MGGIGNQLFQYSFGCMIAEKYGGNVCLDLRGLPSRGQQKDSSILDLKIDYLSTKNGNKALNYFWKIWILRSLRSSPSPLSDCLLQVSRQKPLSTSRNKDFSVADFFIDKSAIEHFQGQLPLSLSYVASQGLQTEYTAVAEENTVTIHHRLGDSVRLKESRGQLGSEYFKYAMFQISESTGSVGKIHVYSDEPKLSKRLLSDWLGKYELSWAPLGFTAAEVLTSMARAKHLVLSNSTMSWWAGAGGIHETVVAPTAWDVAGSNHLNLENWKLSEPDWT